MWGPSISLAARPSTCGPSVPAACGAPHTRGHGTMTVAANGRTGSVSRIARAGAEVFEKPSGNGGRASHVPSSVRARPVCELRAAAHTGYPGSRRLVTGGHRRRSRDSPPLVGPRAPSPRFLFRATTPRAAGMRVFRIPPTTHVPRATTVKKSSLSARSARARARAFAATLGVSARAAGTRRARLRLRRTERERRARIIFYYHVLP